MSMGSNPRVLSRLREASPPRGLFRNKNFMTPNILGYYKIVAGYAELSEGRGIFDGDPIFGVTVRPEPDETKKLSKCLFSKKAALEYIEELS